jgi:hypothetical protein
MLSKENQTQVLNDFAERVNKLARINIGASRTVAGKKRRIDNTGKLRSSLDHKVNVSRNSFSLQFLAAAYAQYVDEGRRPGKGAPPAEILKWIKTKPIRVRDKESNQFVEATEARVKSLAFLINRKIKEKGIAPTWFFTEPFNDNFVKLPDDIVEAYMLDMDDFFDFATERDPARWQ